MLRQAGLDKDLRSALDGAPVPYFSKTDRQPYEVTIGADRRLYQRIPGESSDVPMDTFGAANPRDAYLFAMDARGHIFAATSAAVRHHSAFLAGRPGAAFGAMQVRNGRLLRVSDQSGHYAPPRDYSLQFITELERRHCDLSSMQSHYLGRKKSALKKMNARSGTVFERLYPEGPKMKKY